MAHGNTEVEIKIPVDEETFARTREMLVKIAKPMGTSKHSDTYFTPSHRNFVGLRFPSEWMSIRTRDDKAFLTYKHWHPHNSENQTHCDEYETVLSNPEQLERIFSVLNFRKLVTVEKTRELFVYNNELEIALDVVKDLGRFIEIEALKDFGGVEETRKRLIDFSARIGIPNPKMDKRGYPYELMKKKGLIKQPK
jgi:adenylate cyclase class 2